jgi:hypothetical protein
VPLPDNVAKNGDFVLFFTFFLIKISVNYDLIKGVKVAIIPRKNPAKAGIQSIIAEMDKNLTIVLICT